MPKCRARNMDKSIVTNPRVTNYELRARQFDIKSKILFGKVVVTAVRLHGPKEVAVV